MASSQVCSPKPVKRDHNDSLAKVVCTVVHKNILLPSPYGVNEKGGAQKYDHSNEESKGGSDIAPRKPEGEGDA